MSRSCSVRGAQAGGAREVLRTATVPAAAPSPCLGAVEGRRQWQTSASLGGTTHFAPIAVPNPTRSPTNLTWLRSADLCLKAHHVDIGAACLAAPREPSGLDIPRIAANRWITRCWPRDRFPCS